MVFVKHRVAGHKQEMRLLAYDRDRAKVKLNYHQKQVEKYQQLYDFYSDSIIKLEEQSAQESFSK